MRRATDAAGTALITAGLALTVAAGVASGGRAVLLVVYWLCVLAVAPSVLRLRRRLRTHASIERVTAVVEAGQPIGLVAR
jgi:hypothetical protein